MTIRKILIANRGEIACRIIRTARRMGIKTVAVYSDADAKAQHVIMADESVALGGTAARDSYLVMDKIIAAAKKTGADAVHPGYGFLSENAEFAELCAKSGIVFIGPPPSAIRAMGLKSAAKALMEKAKVPVVPGYHGDDQDAANLKRVAAKIGYPVLLKAIAGGGGKGMRRVDNEQGIEEALQGAQREAQSSFGDARILLEKYIVNPRHIEIQVFADNHGNTVYLFERDCSIQRRHQKVIEEAPAPNISDKQRAQMGKAAVDAAHAVGYSGAGTVEFIADQSGNFYFMEMNTRLQVEHPVTEKITGLDLVELQIRVASGEKLPFSQKDLTINGHAIEVRLYAEDPDKDFLPAIGKLHHLEFAPASDYVRIDTGVIGGDSITPYYDPMIAKIIVWDKTRDLAVGRLQNALAQTSVAGTATNLNFLRAIAGHPAFFDAKLSTNFIAEHRDQLHGSKPDYMVDWPFIVAAIADICPRGGDVMAGWRLSGGGDSFLYYREGQKIRHLRVSFTRDVCRVECDGSTYHITKIESTDGACSLMIDGKSISAKIVSAPNGRYVIFAGHSVWVESHRWGDSAGAISNDGGLHSPMPGKVVDVLVTANQNVKKGQALMILEAMKMEHTIKSPFDGKVVEIFYKTGEQVGEGVELLAITGNS